MREPSKECSYASMCLSIYLCMERKLNLYETPMYFSYFDYVSYIMLFGVICISLLTLVKIF